MGSGPWQHPTAAEAWRFEPHALEWTAPDRLQVTGEFTGRATLPTEAPVLVVRGAEGSHRLPVVPESLSGAPGEGQLWRAEFAWEVPPTPFDAAALEFGDDLAVEVGAPKARADEGTPATLSPAGSGAAELHLQSEMFAVQADAREARAEVDRLRTELARATEDLESERARYALDADRFRQGLAAVEGVAQEALAEEKSAREQLATELEHAREAIGSRDAELERLRAEIEAEGDARSELDALRPRVAELERKGEEAAQMRAALKQAEDEAQRARAENERLSSRLARIREALDDPL